MEIYTLHFIVCKDKVKNIQNIYKIDKQKETTVYGQIRQAKKVIIVALVQNTTLDQIHAHHLQNNFSLFRYVKVILKSLQEKKTNPEISWQNQFGFTHHRRYKYAKMNREKPHLVVGTVLRFQLERNERLFKKTQLKS